MPSREPEWNDDEFLTVLRNLNRSDEELSKMVRRSPGAVGALRAGLLAYANGDTHTTLLSEYMRDLLRGREHYLRPVKGAS